MADDRSTDPPVARAVPGFGEFYSRQCPQVLGLASVMCGERMAAEELAQEAFTAALSRWDRVSTMDRPDAWVRRVVVNQSVSRFRRVPAETRAITRSARSPESPEIEADTVAVWTAVRRLPRRLAEVVALVFYADLSHAEVAEVLGMGVETVRTHLKRAKAHLAGLLGDET